MAAIRLSVRRNGERGCVSGEEGTGEERREESGREERSCLAGFSLRRLSAPLEPGGSLLKFHTTIWPMTELIP